MRPVSFKLLLLLGVLLGPACADDSGDTPVDAAPPPVDQEVLAPDQCAPQHSSTCDEGDVYWVDSCGTQQELRQSCTADQTCRWGACCRPAIPTGAFELPAHAIQLHWTFPAAMEHISFKVRSLNDPGEDVGLYLGLFNGQVDGTMFYLGIQTALYKPDVGRVGRGLIFSRWYTQDPEDARVATGGFTQISTHEGAFVGVRLEYAWKAGVDYTVTLARAEQDGNRDWFDLSITDETGQETFAGGLRFMRRDPNVPCTIGPKGTTFDEVYHNATDYSEVPQWQTAIIPRADGQPAQAVESEYPPYPHAEFPNANAYYDVDEDRVHLSIGGDTPRCHAPGQLLP